MVEQFDTTILSVDDAQRLQRQFIQIADTGAADSVNTVLHSLNRIPRSVRVVNVAVASSDDFSWHRLATDDPWTDRLITMRFRPANCRVLLEVF